LGSVQPAKFQLPLLLFPAIGTDGRIFDCLRPSFPELVTPALIVPEKHEPLASYAVRLANQLPIAGPCWLGGLSFGGMLALEVSRHVNAKAVCLLASIRSSEELSPGWKALRPLAGWLPQRADRVARSVAWLVNRTSLWAIPQQYHPLVRHLSQIEEPHLPWALRAIGSWKPDPFPQNLPIFHLHGDRDPILPVKWTAPTKVLPQAGHLLPLVRPLEVIQFLEQCRATVVGDLNPNHST
jgi:pimeloyl-ACP methyl ester carboxylesterase